MNSDGNDLFPLHCLCFVANKHGQVGLYGNPNHIIDLQGDTVGTLYANHRTVILNANIKDTTLGIGKGDHLFAKVCNHRGFEFDGFTFYEVHKAPPICFLVTIIIILVILVNLVISYSSLFAPSE